MPHSRKVMVVREALGISGEYDEEAELVARAQESDRAAWDEIFERHYQRVYVFAFMRVGDAMAAEDVTADVFVEAWRGIRRYNYRGVPFLSWLYRIAHNLVADFLRRSKRAKTQRLEDGAANAPHTADETENVALWQSVSSAFRRLTIEQQQVLVSRFIEGLSLAETAELMGKNENAIKALEFRALKSVRRIPGRGLGESGDGPGGGVRGVG
jgi:RNA polymerase sigma-70 factor (ECF subfamily)